MNDKMSFEEFTKFVGELQDGVLEYLKSKNISYGLAVSVLNNVKKHLESCVWDNVLE